MEGGHERNVAVGLPSTAEAGDGHLLFEQTLHSSFAKGDNDLGLNEFDLPMEPR